MARLELTSLMRTPQILIEQTEGLGFFATISCRPPASWNRDLPIRILASQLGTLTFVFTGRRGTDHKDTLVPLVGTDGS